MTSDDTFVSLHSGLSQTTAKQKRLFLDSIIEKYTCRSLNIEAPDVTLEDVYPEDEWTQTTRGYLADYAENDEVLPLTPKKLQHLNKLKRKKDKKLKSIEKLIEESKLNRTSLSLLDSDLDTDAEEDSISVTQLLTSEGFSKSGQNKSAEFQKQVRTKSCTCSLRDGSQLSDSCNCSSTKNVFGKNSAKDIESMRSSICQESSWNERTLRSGRSYSSANTTNGKTRVQRKQRPNENPRKILCKRKKSCNGDVPGVHDGDGDVDKVSGDREYKSAQILREPVNSCSTTETHSKAQSESVPVSDQVRKSRGASRLSGRNLSKADKRKNCRSNFSSVVDAPLKNPPSVPGNDTNEAYGSGGNDLSYFEDVFLPLVELFPHSSKNSIGSNADYSVESPRYARRITRSLKELMYNLKKPNFPAGQERPVEMVEPSESTLRNGEVSTYFVLFNDCTHGFFDSLEKCQAALASANRDFEEACLISLLSANNESKNSLSGHVKQECVRQPLLNPSKLSTIFEKSDSILSDNVETRNFRNNLSDYETTRVDFVPVEPHVPFVVNGNEVRSHDIANSSSRDSHGKKLLSSIHNDNFADNRGSFPVCASNIEFNFGDGLREDLEANAKDEMHDKTARLSKSEMNSFRNLTPDMNGSLLGEGVVDSSKTSKKTTCSENVVPSPLPAVEEDGHLVTGAQATLGAACCGTSLQQSEQMAGQAFGINSSPSLLEPSLNGVNTADLSAEIGVVSSPKEYRNEFKSRDEDVLGGSSTCKFQCGEDFVSSVEATIKKTSELSTFDFRKQAFISEREKKVEGTSVHAVPDASPSLPSNSPILATQDLEESSSSSKRRVLKSRKSWRKPRKSLLTRKRKAKSKAGFATAMQDSVSKEPSSSRPSDDRMACGAFGQQNITIKSPKDDTSCHAQPATEQVAQREHFPAPKNTPLQNVGQRLSPGAHCMPMSNIEKGETQALGVESISASSLNTDDLVQLIQVSENDSKTKLPPLVIGNLNKSSASQRRSRDSESSGRRTSFSFHDNDDSCDEELEEWMSRPAVTCSESSTGPPSILSLCHRPSTKLHSSHFSKKLIDSMLEEEDW